MGEQGWREESRQREIDILILSVYSSWKVIKWCDGSSQEDVKWSYSFVSDTLWPHSLLGSRVLEWVTISFSRGSSQPRDWTQVSHTAGRHFTIWATSIPGSHMVNIEKSCEPVIKPSLVWTQSFCTTQQALQVRHAFCLFLTNAPAGPINILTHIWKD